jgi:hypothetical protein
VSGRLWTAEVAGLPCTVEIGAGREWIVIVASTSVCRGEHLASVIREVTGGIARHAEAKALAMAVTAREESVHTL